MRPASKISQNSTENTLVLVTEIHMGPLVGSEESVSVCVQSTYTIHIQPYINLLGDVCSLILISIETSNSYGLEHVNKFWPFVNVVVVLLSFFRILFIVTQNWELTIWMCDSIGLKLDAHCPHSDTTQSVTRVRNLICNSTVWPHWRT